MCTLTVGKMFWSLSDWWHASQLKTSKSQTPAKWTQIAKRTLQRRFDLSDADWGEAEAVCEDARFHKSQTKVSTKCLVFHLLPA